MTTTFVITNIDCEACVKLSSRVLRDLPGVTDVVIDAATGNTTVTATQDIAWEGIHSALQSVGKEAVQQVK